MRYFFVLFFLFSALLAVYSTPVYEEAGMHVFENPSDVKNSFIYFMLIILFTIFILFSIKYRKLLILVIYSVTFVAIYYVLLPFMGIFSLVISLVLVLILALRPNWIIMNISALLLSAGISAIFGISLEPMPVIVLLAILSVYDVISVYKTKHMISLAESIAGIKAPMLFIIPIKGKNAYMGVGDVVMPCILAASIQRYFQAPKLFFIKIPTLTSILGATIGLLVLISLIERKGGAHPGLPFVNLGAVVGFLFGVMI
ncbi:hypothetical protein DRP04_01185 [Archaeoglobales archaeon]|nr:MAG: hypothetical protein DRP04_01185 [Archaeoglobales archaeon]